MREIKLKRAKKRQLTENAWDSRQRCETWQGWHSATWVCRFNNYTFKSAIWTSQFLHIFQIADLKVSIFLQNFEIADLNVSLCMCKQICEGLLVLYVMQ